jgi:HPt (histidine-containing phosphotransfer) domain-containing protein
MTTEPADILSQRLAALRTAYAEHLPQRVRAIEEAAAALRAGDGEALRSLYHLVHRLTGSSAIYGFQQLSRASAALEDVLLPAWTGQGPSTVAGPASIAPLVDAIKRELAAARTVAGPPPPGTGR